MENIAYRVRIVRGDQEFEAEGDKDFVLQMLERYSPSVQLDQTRLSESHDILASTLVDKSLSVGEFIRRLRFKKHTDIVLAFGYFLEKQSGITQFSAADIKNLYYEAKLESSNISQMLILNIRRGFVMEAKNQDTKAKRLYTVTRSGEEFVEQGLQNQTG